MATQLLNPCSCRVGFYPQRERASDSVSQLAALYLSRQGPRPLQDPTVEKQQPQVVIFASGHLVTDCRSEDSLLGLHTPVKSLDCYYQRFPRPLQLICQSGPQNSEKHCTYLITSLFLFIEDYNSGTAIWKRCTGQGMGKRAQSCHTMSMPLSPTLHMFTNLEALRTLSFWGFMGASLCRQH